MSRLTFFAAIVAVMLAGCATAERSLLPSTFSREMSRLCRLPTSNETEIIS